MNTIKYQTIIILAFLFVQCCEKNIQGNEKRITIDLEERTETSVFDLTDSITVVPLHTSDSCLIATINQIEKKKDTLYIYDMQQLLSSVSKQTEAIFSEFQTKGMDLKNINI